MRHARGVAAALTALPAVAFAQLDPPAFPGAIGYGRHATGWRGGAVVAVTTLEDAGAGSLRACAEDRSGPRVCVFSVSGDIFLDSPIMVASNVYIAGQTAPGEGVQLRLGNASASPLVIESAEDVVIRFLKIRPGPGAHPSSTVDGVTIARSRKVYLDNLSIAFATDENLNIHAGPEPASDISVTDSIIAWALDRSNHPNGAHSKGALICSMGKAPGPCGRVSLRGNLFANNRDRNPEVKGAGLGPIDVVGNVFFNPLSEFAEIYNDAGDTRVNFVGNVAIPGPSTRSAPRPPAARIDRRRDDAVLEVYAPFGSGDTVAPCGGGAAPPLGGDAAVDAAAVRPVAPLRPHATSPVDIVWTVLSVAGARSPAAFGPDRLDRRLLDEVTACEGRIVDHPRDVGGWPVLERRNGPPDSDGDGMPDFYEALRPWLDPRRAGAWEDPDGDGWSNLETYLAARAGDPVERSPTR